MRSDAPTTEARDDAVRGRVTSAGAAPPSVLVIDDEPLWQRSLERVLRGQGLRVACIASGAGLDPWLAGAGIDALILDLGLEGGASAGVELLVRARRLQPDLAVVVMTGSASIESAVACMRRGAFDYLAKPFDDIEAVRATVRKAVDHRRRALAARAPAPPIDDAALPLSLAAYERRALERALAEHAGDATAAARRLGIGRSTFYRKLAAHGVRTGRTGGAPDGPRGLGGAGSIR
ncbi:MAG: response regulator [Myxococcales bacterium]|nr:response regulator [Myxococcales bacterium]